MRPELVSKVKKISPVYSEAEVIGFTNCPMVRNGKQIYIADWSCDTIFSLEAGQLKSQMVKTPSGIDQQPQIICCVILRTDRYTFMSSVKKEVTASMLKTGRIPNIDIVCDHRTGKSYKPSFVNKDYDFSKRNYSIDAVGMELPENCALSYFPVSRLLEDDQAGKIFGKLKEIVSALDEEDNPVLMLVKFKE